uniref:Uncharacterized protein n=1 Tax=Anopheles melas TaxID=34690 RepID=A0A182U1C3_9DIPT
MFTVQQIGHLISNTSHDVDGKSVLFALYHRTILLAQCVPNIRRNKRTRQPTCDEIKSIIRWLRHTFSASAFLSTGATAGLASTSWDRKSSYASFTFGGSVPIFTLRNVSTIPSAQPLSIANSEIQGISLMMPLIVCMPRNHSSMISNQCSLYCIDTTSACGSFDSSMLYASHRNRIVVWMYRQMEKSFFLIFDACCFSKSSPSTAR